MKRKTEKKNEKSPEAKIPSVTPGALDKDGIYRLHIPMEAYNLVQDYLKVSGKLASFIESTIPCLTGTADVRKSIVRILSSRYGEDCANSMLDAFVIECRQFHTELALGMYGFNWSHAGEEIARERLEERARKESGE